MGTESTDRHAVTDVGTFTALLENPALAESYLAFLSGEARTTPDVQAVVDISKKTAYSYVDRLHHAGLLTETGDEATGEATSYEAEPFQLTVAVGGETTTITPEIIEVVARRTDEDAVATTVDRHGLSTLSDFLQLSREHANGTVTTREMAARLDLSVGVAYDLLRVVYETLDLTGATEGNETIEPKDVEFEAGSLREQLSE